MLAELGALFSPGSACLIARRHQGGGSQAIDPAQDRPARLQRDKNDNAAIPANLPERPN